MTRRRSSTLSPITLAITTIVIAQVLLAVVGLAKLYEPSIEILVGIQPVLAMALSAVSTGPGWSDDTVPGAAQAAPEYLNQHRDVLSRRVG